jgi:hypothetical protein
MSPINPKATATVRDYLTIETLIRERPSLANMERAVQLFPSCVMFWTSYLDFLIENPEKAYKIAGKAVENCAHVDLWRRYLALGKSLYRLPQLFPIYEKAVGEIGCDPKCVDFWIEYLYLLRAIFNTQLLVQYQVEDASRLPLGAYLLPLSSVRPPGLSEDLLDMEGINMMAETGVRPTIQLIRDVFQNALSVPMERIDSVWDEYQAFEQVIASAMNHMAQSIPVMPGMPPPPAALASVQCSKLLSEYSNRWIQSKQALKDVSRIYANVNMYFAPIPLESGTAEALRVNVLGWRRVLEWEKANPLKLNYMRFQARMAMVFKQCLMSNVYVSEFWFELFVARLCSEGYDGGLAVLHKGISEYLVNDVMLRVVVAMIYEETNEIDRAVNWLEDSLTFFETVVKRPAPSLLIHLVKLRMRSVGPMQARTTFMEYMHRKSIHVSHYGVFVEFSQLEKRALGNPENASTILELGKALFVDNPEALAALTRSDDEISPPPKLLSWDVKQAREHLRMGAMWPISYLDETPVTSTLDLIDIDGDDPVLSGNPLRPDPSRMNSYKPGMEYDGPSESAAGEDKFKSVPGSLRYLVNMLPRCEPGAVAETDSILKSLQTLDLPALNVANIRYRFEDDPQLDRIRRDRETGQTETSAGQGGANLKRLIMPSEDKVKDQYGVIIKSDYIDDERNQREFLSALAANIHRERINYKRHKLLTSIV